MNEPDSEDFVALRLLRSSGYKQRGGILYHPNANHIESQEEKEAINFLCAEWDYGWVKSESELN